MVQGLFAQNTLLDVIRNFIFIPDVSRRDEKVLCRYPQYYAATELYQNIVEHMRPEGDGNRRAGAPRRAALNAAAPAHPPRKLNTAPPQPTHTPPRPPARPANPTPP